jgi:hypothetical protein
MIGALAVMFDLTIALRDTGEACDEIYLSRKLDRC